MTSPGTPPAGREEREVKIRVPDAAACAENVLSAGGKHLEGPLIEDDRLFDDDRSRLRGRDRVLRLRRKLALDDRRTVRAVLTYKGPAREEDGARVREEIETGVADADALEDVLARLGYIQTFRYQKRRTLFALADALLAVDVTPLGDFLEIEGTSGVIEDVAGRLGFTAADYLTDSYASLWRARHPDDTPDMLLADEDEGSPS